MAGPWEEFTPGQAQESGPWSDFAQPTPQKKQNKGLAADLGTDLKRGIMSIPGMATGLADVAVVPIAKASAALEELTAEV